MKREEELKKIVGEDIILLQLIEEVLFLEEKLKNLKELPFIQVNPKNKNQQKATVAGKQYKELLQQYINCIKVINAKFDHEGEEDSPLRKWVKDHINKKK